MAQVLHQRAKTTHAIRKDIQRSSASIAELSRRYNLNPKKVRKWRSRFADYGLGSLNDEVRSGRPRSISDDMVQDVIDRVLQEKLKDASHWSTRSMSEVTGISPVSVYRIWRASGLKPHMEKTFKLSTDPAFVDKVHDVVGLYMDPPDRAIVPSVDEKS